MGSAAQILSRADESCLPDQLKWQDRDDHSWDPTGFEWMMTGFAECLI